MADPRKVKVLDSYQTLKAVRTAADSDAVSGAPLPARPRKKTVPTKQFIICYECGYTFQLHGRAKKVPCSKCRASLDLTDHIITGKWSGPLKTAASIHIKPEAVVQAGDLVGKTVLLDGKLEAGTVRALERLEIGPRAKFDEGSIHAPNLLVGDEADVTFRQASQWRDLEIHGTVRAAVLATGRVIIRSGGLLEGELTAEHLQVEEGGGLRARVTIATAASSKP